MNNTNTKTLSDGMTSIIESMTVLKVGGGEFMFSMQVPREPLNIGGLDFPRRNAVATFSFDQVRRGDCAAFFETDVDKKAVVRLSQRVVADHRAFS